MTQEQGPKGKVEISQFTELRYARDLFVHLFRDGIPFVNLGYGSAQVQTALTALRQLENEEGIVTSPHLVRFTDEDQYYSSTLLRLKHGGWQLVADRNILKQLKDAATESETREMIFLKYMTYKPQVPFFTNESADYMLILDMLPTGEGLEDIGKLVPKLYETVEFTGRDFDSMIEDTPVNRFRARFFSPYHSTFRAAWFDDETKRDLVIQHVDRHTRRMAKHGSYGEDQEEGKIDIWRRLPKQELDGKSWTPFGRKLSASSEQAMRAFESDRSVVTGKLVLAPQKV